ncbi:MAG: type III pantothenate kinase [Candidatus Aminicenantes bacterium]|nr:type III pantothenate kinase [Candidatus Aminicenantes bacterium]
MLLAIDIGNTNIAIGVFNKNKLVEHWWIKSERDKTRDEYSILILELLSLADLDKSKIAGVIISSVVPPLTPVFQSLSRSLFLKKPMIVGPGLKTGMSILYENPQEVGADRIVASISAYDKFAGPVIICDFGTATTFDVVSGQGEYLGGAIAPGIKISAEALYIRTAKLPHVEIRKPDKAIGRTTVTSIQSGLYFGYIGLVTNIIHEMIKELGGQATVISTGGFAGKIFQDIDVIDHYEPHLVLEGLRILYDRNI